MNKTRGFFKNYTGTILIFSVIILMYHYATSNEILDSFLFPTIGKIGEGFMEKFPELIEGMFSSFALLFPAIILALIVALLVGVPLGLYSNIKVTLHPIIYALSVIPSILLSPFAIHLAPNFRIASLFLIFYNTLWPTLFATINGISTINKGYLDTAATLEINGLKRLFKVILPAAFPAISSGLITSVRSSFLVLSFSEMLGTDGGMGYFIQHYANLGLFTNVWVGFIFMVIVLVLVMLILENINSYILRWTE